MELVRQRLADHLGCHPAQLTLFRLEDSEEEKASEDSEEDIPFVDGECYGVVVHSILPLYLTLQSESVTHDLFTFHLLRKFTLSFFTPIPYRLLHEIHFYYDEDTMWFYSEECVRSRPRMTYVMVEDEGEDTLYDLIRYTPFLQADYVDREKVAREAERLFQKYMVEVEEQEEELLTDEELEEPEEL